MTNNVSEMPGGAFASGGSQHAVVLPCEPEHFNEFIGGLLGKPQTIERVKSGPFTVSKSDIENLHHLLMQRVTSQNQATLVGFSVKTMYDDGSSVTINSLEDYLIYGEVKPLVARSLIVSWILIVKFPLKGAPEKQQIDISFRAGPVREAGGVVFHIGDDGPVRMLSNCMMVRVAHTDRTWGADMENLIEGSLSNLVKEDSKSRRFFSRNAGWFGLGTGATIVGISLFAAYRVTSNLIGDYLEGAERIYSLQSSSPEVLQRKIDFVLSVIASGMWTRYAFYVTGLMIVSIIISLIVALFVSIAFDVRMPSFITTTSKSVEHREIIIRKLNNNWRNLLLSVSGALILSVAANYIFAALVKFIQV